MLKFRSCFMKHFNKSFKHIQFYSTRADSKKVCIIGSGPAGFYTAQQILKNNNVIVDIYEKLPVPFGLIRYGVAPDHPEIKVVTNTFTKVAQNERCNFFGNLNVGKDITVPELLNAYHAVVLAFGASEDKKLGIPGEESSNILSARDFVNWYNGHPDFVSTKVNLNVDVAAIIGQGNVALDVARILLHNYDNLKTTDIAQYALDALQKSSIKKVVLIGRRGPLQVAFTIKEFREVTKLQGCSTLISSKDLEGVPEIIPSLPRPKKRLTELLVNTVKDTVMEDGNKILEIKYYRSPKSVVCDSDGQVKKLILGLNRIEGSPETGKIVSTGETEEIDCGLILKSVGYRSIPIDPCIPFDENSHVIPNERGKVIGKEGLYCSGWVKTGPVGVIISTMNSSFETGEKILKDMEQEECFKKQCEGNSGILRLLKERGVKYTTFDDWLKIDKVEREKGKSIGKPREKICSISEMLKTVNLYR